MGGCTVISNISVKIKVTADLLYMHLHITDIVSHSKCLKSYICILYVAYMLFFSSDVQYILGSVCWLLRADGGEAGILQLIYGYKKRKENAT